MSDITDEEGASCETCERTGLVARDSTGLADAVLEAMSEIRALLGMDESEADDPQKTVSAMRDYMAGAEASATGSEPAAWLAENQDGSLDAYKDVHSLIDDCRQGFPVYATPTTVQAEEPVAWMRAAANLWHGYEACAEGDPNGFPVFASPTGEPIDVEQMLRDCVPGGSSCDPQTIADDIRGWFARNAA